MKIKVVKGKVGDVNEKQSKGKQNSIVGNGIEI